ncbi:MAG: TIGR02996 domain-containing protein, partial [Archangium sp.]|nr:TIGR02996 domain-containing protein [Archangium sp.]
MTLEAELETLLALFQKTRQPRVADAIDRVSLDLAKARGPVPGKSVTAKLTAAAELAKKKDLADLGRITQVEWPGTWQKGLPLLRALLESYPGDPRLEAHLAKTFAEPPWDSWASWGFFNVLHQALRSLTDTRLIPVLEAGDSRAHPGWYRRSFQSWVQATITRLKATTPAELSASDLAKLAPIEARYAEDKSREKEKARGEAELLEAIYARPNDPQARAVFADWLTERNDPRGECITLQLSPGRTRAQQSRLNALLKKHGADWAGSLDEWFVHDARRFELGFLVGGKLVERFPRPIEESLKDPLWKMVSALEVDRYGQPPISLVKQLRELHGVEPQAWVKVLNGKEPLELEVLTFGRTWGDEAFNGLGECRAAKKLHTIGFVLNSYNEFPLDELPVLARVEKVLFRGNADAQAIVGKLAKKFPNVKALEFITGDEWLFPDGSWRVGLSREGPGPFTSVNGYTTNTEILGTILAATEPAKVTSLRIEANRTLPLREREREHAEKTLSQFKSAKIEVPWEREVAAPATPVVRKTGEKLTLQLTGGTFLTKDMEPVWSLLTGSGFSFDAYRVGYGGAHRPLGAKPAVTLSKWGVNERCHRLELYRDGSEEKVTFGRRRRGWDSELRLEFQWNARVPEQFVAWLESLLAIGGDVTCGSLASDAEQHTLFGHERGARLIIYGSEFRKRLPEKKAIAAVKKLGGFVHAGKHALYFSATSMEKKQTDAAMTALREALWPLVLEHFVERTGLDFQRELEKSVWKAATALGFKSSTSDEDRAGAVELEL